MVIKRSSYGSALHYLDGRPATITRYLQRFYPPYDWHVIKKFFFDNPIQAKVILKDFSKSNDQKLRLVAQIFIMGKSKIVYIVGARDSGKTATAFMFAESVHYEIGRPIYYIAPPVKKEILPKWCRVVATIQEAPNGCFAIIDEASIQYHSREFYTKESIDMSKILAIARHKDIFLIFITQDTALADVNIRRLRDIVIWKRSNDYSLTERGSRYAKEQTFWKKVRSMMSPRDKPECLFEFPAQRRFIHFAHPLPECWTEELSKSWSDYQKTIKEESTIKSKELKPEVMYV